MIDKLSEQEQKALLEGVDPNGPTMDTEEFKSMWINYYLQDGKTIDEANKIVDDLCKKHGVK